MTFFKLTKYAYYYLVIQKFLKLKLFQNNLLEPDEDEKKRVEKIKNDYTKLEKALVLIKDINTQV